MHSAPDSAVRGALPEQEGDDEDLPALEEDVDEGSRMEVRSAACLGSHPCLDWTQLNRMHEEAPGTPTGLHATRMHVAVHM